MTDKQNDWDKYSSDLEGENDKRSNSVYNEREIAYLDKYSDMAKKTMDETELYELIVEMNFDDEKIEKALRSKLKYIEAKGEEYGWQKVTERGKAQQEQTYAGGGQGQGRGYYNETSGYSNKGYDMRGNNYSERYYNDKRPYNSNSRNNEYYGSSSINSRGGGGGGYRRNNNYNISNKGYSISNTHNYKTKKKKRPFEECIEVPIDYKPNAIQEKDNEKDNDKALVDKRKDIINEDDINQQKQQQTIFMLYNDLKPEPKKLIIKPEEVADIFNTEKDHYTPEAVEEEHNDNTHNKDHGYNEYNNSAAQYIPKIDYDNDFHIEDKNRLDNDDEDDEVDYEKQWRENNLKLYLNKLKNYGLQEPKKKNSSLKELNKEEDKSKSKEDKYHHIMTHNFEIETSKHKQIEKKRNYIQTKAETYTINACYDTPNRMEFIQQPSLALANNVPLQAYAQSQAMKQMPTPMEGYYPMMQIPPQYYPPFMYPYGYIPPPTQKINITTNKPPDVTTPTQMPISTTIPLNQNPMPPYPYPMFIPMYPNPYEIKPTQDQAQLQTQMPK